MRLFKNAAVCMMLSFTTVCTASAQYMDLSGNNPDIQEYVEATPENWNRPIIYVFYNGEDACFSCSRAIDMIYRIYQQYYAGSCSIFEIDYSQDYQMQIDYNLSQPLSIVAVRINDGMSRGYYKIDNPQNWLDDPFYMERQITTEINNFLHL
ncbi:MAG: hypothetical protein J6Y91_01290 [Alphaproteobacteria bacterium]|nr:hypothetical protein [Alphaproteobacteria bacterium]